MATKLLKELHREAKTSRDWYLCWVHSFSRFSHRRCQNQGPVDQVSNMLKTITLLGTLPPLCPGEHEPRHDPLRILPRADSPLLFFLPVEDLQADCASAKARVFRYQKILQGSSYDILAAAVGRNPSLLGTIEPEKAQRVATLSGADWPSENPKVTQIVT